MYIYRPVKYPLFLSDFNETRTCLTYLKKKLPNFMEICPVGAALFHANGWMDKHRMKVTVTFRNFVNAPENSL